MKTSFEQNIIIVKPVIVSKTKTPPPLNPTPYTNIALFLILVLVFIMAGMGFYLTHDDAPTLTYVGQLQGWVESFMLNR